MIVTFLGTILQPVFSILGLPSPTKLLLPMDQLHQLSEQYVNLSNILFKEKRFVDYRTGGFHSVALGDTLNGGRYKLRHKLGHGGFSAVWAARDLRYVFVSLTMVLCY